MIECQIKRQLAAGGLRSLALCGLLGAVALTTTAAAKTRVDASGEAQTGGCVHDHKLPPLKLSARHRELLASVSSTPKTALDYYMSLPASYFGVMDDNRERRVWYVDLATLTSDRLKASYSFECDGGHFDVDIKLLPGHGGDVVALQASVNDVQSIFNDGDGGKLHGSL